MSIDNAQLTNADEFTQRILLPSFVNQQFWDKYGNFDKRNIRIRNRSTSWNID